MAASDLAALSRNTTESELGAIFHRNVEKCAKKGKNIEHKELFRVIKSGLRRLPPHVLLDKKTKKLIETAVEDIFVKSELKDLTELRHLEKVVECASYDNKIVKYLAPALQNLVAFRKRHQEITDVFLTMPGSMKYDSGFAEIEAESIKESRPDWFGKEWKKGFGKYLAQKSKEVAAAAVATSADKVDACEKADENVCDSDDETYVYMKPAASISRSNSTNSDIY